MKKVFFSILVLVQTGSTSLFAQNWQNLGFTLDRQVNVLFTDTISNLLYVGGSGFTYINGNYIRGIFYWDGTNYHNMGSGIDLGGTPGSVSAINRYQNEIYVGGGFSYVGGHYSKGFAGWNGISWDSIGCNGAVLDIEIFNNEMYVCGTFDSIAGIPAHYAAKFNGSTWSAINCPTSLSGIVARIAVYNGETYIGGSFASTQITFRNIVKYNGFTWSNLGNGVPGSISEVSNFEIYQNELYVMGRFLTSNGNASTSIMKWDGSNWSAAGNGVNGINPAVFSSLICNGKLYVVGTFIIASGIPADKIAVWDGLKWCAFGDTFNNSIGTIAVYNNQLIIAGGFTQIDTDSTYTYMAKWIGGSFIDTCSVEFTGVEEISYNEEVNIYPNPVSSILTVRAEKERIKNICVMNALGEILLKEEVNEKESNVDISTLAKGMYFVQLISKDKKTTLKFIKQ